LGARLGAVSYTAFVVPLQHFIAQTDFIADADAKPKTTHFKGPISGIDAPVPCCEFVFAEIVFATPAEFPPAPEKELPDGYVTIFIPPA
jgi:hypothetical protein